MLLDMDSELQHLISISMDKMTSGAGASTAGHGGRKSRSLDLRKALLVAHFLQEVRCAYFEEDYEIVANTITDLKSGHYDKKMEVNEQDVEYDTVKDVNQRYAEESQTYLIDSDLRTKSPPSSSVLQSCVTNSDVMVSRISQVTRPLSVSINTNHVMSLDLCSAKENNGDACEEEDVPAICEELEVSSCCEVASAEEDVPENPVVSSRDHAASVVNRMKPLTGNKHAEAISEVRESSPLSCSTSVVDDVTTKSRDNQRLLPTKKTSTTCPLPKKKRPVPKEFLDNQFYAPVSKTARTNCISTEACSSSSSSLVSPSSIANTVTLESKTSTSLSTVCSVMGTTSPYVNTKWETMQRTPKVVVQLTQACDSYLPITCTQLLLEKRLSEFNAFSFDGAAS